MTDETREITPLPSAATDKTLALRRRRLFHFADARYHVEVHRGKRGRWRWSVKDVQSNRTVALSPVRGWETEMFAEEDARQFFLELGVDVTDA